MIKNLWSKIAYIWFVLMLAIVGFLTGNLDVKADELTSWSTFQNRVQLDHNGTYEWTSWYTDYKNYGTDLLIYPVRSIQWRVKAPNGLNRENTYTFDFNWRPTPDSLGVTEYYIKAEGDVDREEITCTNWRADSGYYHYKCTFTPLNNFSSSDWLYIRVNFYESYQTQLRVNITGFEERKGTNAVITEQTNNIINNDNKNTQEIIDNITDDEVDSPNDEISDFEDMLPSNGTITQLIGLPITLYNKVLNSINGTCSQFNLGSLYNHELIIPCIDVSQYLGSNIWSTIDIIISGSFVFIIARKMIKAFEGFTSMKEGDVIND